MNQPHPDTALALKFDKECQAKDCLEDRRTFGVVVVATRRGRLVGFLRAASVAVTASKA